MNYYTAVSPFWFVAVLTIDREPIIDSVRSPRSDAYLMLKLIVSDRRSDSKQAEN